jgi:hypothetical protein
VTILMFLRGSICVVYSISNVSSSGLPDSTIHCDNKSFPCPSKHEINSPFVSRSLYFFSNVCLSWSSMSVGYWFMLYFARGIVIVNPCRTSVLSFEHWLLYAVCWPLFTWLVCIQEEHGGLFFCCISLFHWGHYRLLKTMKNVCECGVV